MIALRIHYLVGRIPLLIDPNGKARCGNPCRNWTIYPAEVTCESCKKLMKGEVK